MCSFISYCRDINTNNFDLALPKYPPQLNLSATANFAIVEWFKQESMYGMSAKNSGRCREVLTRVNVWTVRQKNGHCREVPIGGGSTVIKEYYGILRSGSSNTKGFILVPGLIEWVQI